MFSQCLLPCKGHYHSWDLDCCGPHYDLRWGARSIAALLFPLCTMHSWQAEALQGRAGANSQSRISCGLSSCCLTACLLATCANTNASEVILAVRLHQGCRCERTSAGANGSAQASQDQIGLQNGQGIRGQLEDTEVADARPLRRHVAGKLQQYDNTLLLCLALASADCICMESTTYENSPSITIFCSAACGPPAPAKPSQAP